nr:cationic peroxidase 2-like [Ipomoea batatas]
MFLVAAMAATMVFGQGTRVGFYLTTCPTVETIVRSAVNSHFQSDPTVAPALLRLHFHDCFVRGCDASVLIDGPNAEKTFLFNQGLRGYEVIDDAKQQVEAACPGVVSCADILALAARDSVVLTNGPTWAVPLGRRDGLVSVASDASNLPAFTDSVDVQRQKFSDKGLNTQDLVTLVGGHTIGTSACQFFSYRLQSNFSANGPDPTIDPAFLATLQSLCQGGGSTRVALDNGSGNTFDTSYFDNLRNNRGVLESDQKLWNDNSTKPIVEGFLGIAGVLGLRFSVEFATSMVKMSNIEVKTGTDGEIRRGCDGSILIDGSGTEKTAVFNQGLRGYEVVDDAKKQLEAACPGVVSCADILALAARDSVVLTSGLTWAVPTGRRDGRVSSAADAANLPGFTDSVDVQKQKFSDKGLSAQDLVTLVGGHTIGTTACQFFNYRLYNTSSATIDPSIDPSFLPTLQNLCPQGGDGTKRVSLDDGSETKFDTSFFSNLQKGHGILESDQKLWTDSSTKTFVQRFLGIRGLLGLTFSVEFGKSMVKMSNIGVKTGSDGEIRKVCSAFN